MRADRPTHAENQSVLRGLLRFFFLSVAFVLVSLTHAALK